VAALLGDRELRQQIAERGRADVEQHFDWKKIGELQRASIQHLLPPRVQIRLAEKTDIPEISAIQATAQEASQWHPSDYLAHECRVATVEGRVVGFIVTRRVAENEREILNIAVHPDFRRLGIGAQLLRFELNRAPGAHFLEVRESNAPARELYRRLGFEVVGSRPGYYDDPPETGIVMRIFS